MGRPRQFDVDRVLWEAVKVFWRLGYNATAVQDLVDAMGIERGSLYRTFGDKQALFQRAVEHYNQHQIARLPPGADAMTTLRAWFANNLDDARDGDLPSGCLVINSAVEMPALPPPLQKLVARHIAQLRRFFRRCVEAGQAAGQLAGSVEPDEKAESLLAAIIGINVMSRAGASHAQLARIARDALAFAS
ncbi:MAG TPA: TetR/AcrR family transcriptional regulator [Kofleriaceae bacterium]|nr:TetR/AcrR family transcriptional regulator [Kofleriaceae bacterium]